MYRTYRSLRLEQEDGVLTIALNRPKAFNAVNAEMHTELSTIFAEVAVDDTVKAVVLTGAGRAFCGGGDLKWIKDIKESELDRMMVEARKIIVDLVELPQPIVAAVNGVAAGLGATLALFCDVVYMADDAKIMDPHVAIGVTAGDGGAVIWPLLTSMARAKEFLMTGDAVSAEVAERIGLVNYVVPSDAVLDDANRFARRLCVGSEMAIKSTKFVMNKYVRDGVNLLLDTSLALEKECFRSEFHKDAVAAFSAKVKKSRDGDER